jgi:putative transcriptional regulator
MKNNIRVERAIKNITQEELSKLVQVSRQTINAIESGKYVPSTLLSLKISKIFEKSVNDIFQLEEWDWKKS